MGKFSSVRDRDFHLALRDQDLGRFKGEVGGRYLDFPRLLSKDEGGYPEGGQKQPQASTFYLHSPYLYWD